MARPYALMVFDRPINGMLALAKPFASAMARFRGFM
ncbi:hypothetical protein [Sporisorium scitamineum]|uniref:Uncharacterized protein n=1 Tax=Sporisorium scitamineum TaxID=49012 RepID=A0A0F7S291_9BASI|nr:hypothetical protein [Sporisorium scitamineum]